MTGFVVVSGHQPVYLPWAGLFHKVYLSDTFVYMDTVKYLKEDWNNRNKIRTPNGWMWLSVPIDRVASGRNLHETIIKQDAGDLENGWQGKHWRGILANYKKAPYFPEYARRFQEIYLRKIWTNLVDLCWSQFTEILKILRLDDRKIIRMTDRSFAGTKDDLILNHCLNLNCNAVVFGALGRNYVAREKFSSRGIPIHFQGYNHPTYEQRFPGFESHMTVLDMIFNLGGEAARRTLLDGNISRDELHNQFRASLNGDF